MRRIVLREGSVYPSDHIQQLIGLSAETAPLVTPTATKQPGGRIYYYTVKFVGIVSVSNTIYIMVPKFFPVAPSPQQLSTMTVVIDAIRRYKDTNSFNEDGYRPNTDSTNDDIFSISKFMVEEYTRFGLYSLNSSQQTNRGVWSIDWPRTVASQIPIFQNGRPYYLDFTMTRSRLDEFNFFTQLHAAALSDVSRLLAPTDISTLAGIPTPILSNHTVSDFGSPEELLARLRSEMSTQFVSWKLRILQCLTDYLLLTSRTGESTPVWIGTHYFNLVWESACKEYFGSQGDVFDLENPVWEYIPDVESFQTQRHPRTVIAPSPGGLTPDILPIVDSHLYILDAKYYSPLYAVSKLKKTPGVGDIVKQYFYGMALSSAAGKNGLKIRGNAFLIPFYADCDCSCHIRGEVRIPFIDQSLRSSSSGFDEGALSHIRVIDLNAIPVLASYCGLERPANLPIESWFKYDIGTAFADRGDVAFDPISAKDHSHLEDAISSFANQADGGSSTPCDSPPADFFHRFFNVSPFREHESIVDSDGFD